MIIHIISDIHLERYKDTEASNFEDIEKLNPTIFSKSLDPNKRETSEVTLMLAGDIGHPNRQNYWKFIKDCSDKYKNVILISGNHEYYNVPNKETRNTTFSMSSVDKLIDDKIIELELNNVYFLNKTSVQIDGYNIVGTTMWSNISKEHEQTIVQCVNDYNHIFDDELKRITTEHINTLHKDQLNWLKNNISDNTIVITHHLPTSHLSHEKYSKYNSISSSIWTDLTDENIYSNKIKLWICGHTHTPMEYLQMDTNTLFVTNPLGHYKENNGSIMREITMK